MVTDEFRAAAETESATPITVDGYGDLRAMVLVFQPELTCSVWQDFFAEDEDGGSLGREELIEELKSGVRDGRWVGWRLIRIEKDVLRNVDYQGYI